MTVAFLDVVSFAPIKAGFLERIDGTLDIGGNYTKSSGVGQVSVDLDADYRRPFYDIFTNFMSTATREQESTTFTQFTLRSGYLHFRDDGLVLSPFAWVARNPDLGFSLATAGAFTVGRYLRRSNRGELLAAIGLGVGREELIDGRSIADIEPQVSGVSRNDVGVSFSIGWIF